MRKNWLKDHLMGQHASSVASTDSEVLEKVHKNVHEQKFFREGQAHEHQTKEKA